MHMHPVFNRRKTKIVGLSEVRTRFDATARKPHRKSIDMMISTSSFTQFRHRCSAKLSTPNHQGVVQQTPLFQIGDQCCAGSIHISTNLFNPRFQIRIPTSMMIPIGMVKLNKTSASLNQSSCKQTVSGKRGFRNIRPIKIKCALIFLGKINQLRGARLHPVCHFIRCNPTCNFGVARIKKPDRIQIPNCINNMALILFRNTFRS